MCTLINLAIVFVVNGMRCNGLLFPSGPTAGDSSIVTSDDVAYAVDLISPFAFFGTPYERVFFTDNGIISFEPFRNYIPLDSLRDNYPAIIAVLHDDFKGHGKPIYYRSSDTTGDLQKARQYVEELYPDLAPYNPTAVTVVTWYEYPNYQQDQSITNTFQGVLVSHPESPAVLMLYEKIVTIRHNAVVGVRADNGETFEREESRNPSLLLDLDINGQAETPGLYGYIVVPGERCISDCIGRADGHYQSCIGCHVYASCTAQTIEDNRSCPGDLVWDDIEGRCLHESKTCTTSDGETSPTSPSTISTESHSTDCVEENGCSGLPNGNYQSCIKCDAYVACSNGYYYLMACALDGTVWDDVRKECIYESSTCFIPN